MISDLSFILSLCVTVSRSAMSRSLSTYPRSRYHYQELISTGLAGGNVDHLPSCLQEPIRLESEQVNVTPVLQSVCRDRHLLGDVYLSELFTRRFNLDGL